MNGDERNRGILAAMSALADSTAKVSPAMKRTAFVLLWLALIAQAIWVAYKHLHLQVPLRDMSYPLTFAAPFVFLAATNGRIRWINALLRLPIAFGFLQAVSDRLGLLGPPGAPGVSWGDFSHFIAYTAQVNAFMPRAIIPALAVLATIAESACGLTMLFGIRIRAAAAGSAALLLVFGTSMIISGLSQFEYGVYVTAAGALALATVDASLLSVDQLLRHMRGGVARTPSPASDSKSDAP